MFFAPETPVAHTHLAEGILKKELGDAFRIEIAGSKPAGYVHPLAIKALAEIGIDVSGNRSKHLDEFINEDIETVITVCGNADQACPMFPGQVNRHHFPFDDPAQRLYCRKRRLGTWQTQPTGRPGDG